MSTARWICQNPECKTRYAEYVNGCPRCYQEHGLFFRVEYETTKEKPPEIDVSEGSVFPI